MLESLVGRILDPIIAIVFRKVGCHVGYVVRYKKNIQELEKEKKNLEEKIDENKEKVEEAKICNDIVKKTVERWAQDAVKVKSEIENLMIDEARDENTKCLKFSFPNLCSRYRMSKQAALKKGDLKELVQGGNFEVVARIRPPPPERQFTSSGNFLNFDSRGGLLELIKNKLKSGDPKDNLIGVHGAGGIGKTTIVEEACKQLKEEGVFDEVVKGVASRDVNVRQIQGQLADQLSLRLVSETEMGRGNELWSRLKNGKKNLVILDDLWEEIKLGDIGIPLRQGNEGCKVILTTRNHRVLTEMGVGECIPVKVLSEDEAWALFERKVGVTFEFAEFHDVAKLVCEECGGLPVAILAVGGALAGTKDIRIWRGVLDQQQNSTWENIEGVNRRMYANLRCSYDYLGKTLIEAKSILLLCCLYPEDDDIPVDFLLFHCIARRILPDNNTVDRARNRIITLVGYLKDRSLLLDGKDKDHVKMHDVIRDVVISIAKTEEQYLVKNITNCWPVESVNKNMAAISVCLKELKEVPNELVCPQLHTLRIECEDSSFLFPDNFFSGVGELTDLELIGTCMSCTPSSLANLSKLRTLIMIVRQLEDMSFLKGLKSNLEALIIADSDIKALPTELGELSHLQVLLLNYCKQLKLIPAGVISKLTHLEELCLPDEFTFWEEFPGRESEDIEISSAELSELGSLTRLTNLSVFIQNVKQVPALNFGNLVKYRIAVVEHFNEDEKYFKERNLKLHGITYHDKVVTLLERAEVLYLYKFNGLKNILLNKEGKGFLELEHFVIRDCHDLEQLLGTPDRYTRYQGPFPSNSYSKLTALKVFGCSFKFLFTSSCAKGLLQLQELEIEDCGILEEIVGTEGEKDEPDDMVYFSKLKELKLTKLPKLLSFGRKITKNATVEGDSLRKGQSLFNEKVIFPALEVLYIWGLPNITEIWDKQVLPTKSFPRLADVDVWACMKLVTVFPSNSWAQSSLRAVGVYLCEGVKVVVSITGLDGSEDANNCPIIFRQLRHVYLWCLENLKAFCGNSTGSEPQSLFDPQVIFPALEELYITGLPNITEIWDKQVLPTMSFPVLADVRVSGCEKLVTVFPSNLWAQISLRVVAVNDCKGVKVVVSIARLDGSEDANNCPIIFPQLRYVHLSSLENLKAFCGNSIGSEPQSLVDPQVRFLALKHIYLENLPNIEIFKQQLSKGEVKFPAIRYLQIGDEEWYNDGKPNMNYLAPQVLE